MPEKALGTSRQILAIALGLLATSIIVVLHAFGLGYRAELQALDFRFSYLSTAPENDRIVHVDIDDRSLEELGRWPWPRAQLAGIVEILQQAGAETVALDIIMPEPQKPRLVSPITDLYSADTGKLLGNPSPREIFDDKILRETLSSYGRVFLPMHVNLSPVPPTDLESRVQEVMRQGELDLETVKRIVLPNLPAYTRTEEFDIVRRAYIKFRGLAALERFAVPVSQIADYPGRSGGITPPLATLAAACYQSGFVTFDPDDDGVVRRIPMLAGDGQRFYPQFALALAADQLARSRGGKFEITANADCLTIRCANGFERTIPVDDQGHMLINWIPQRSKQRYPRHISAAKVGSIYLQKQALRRNRTLRRLLHLHLVGMASEFRTPQIKELYWRIVDLDGQGHKLHQQRVAAEFDRQYALLFAPKDVPPPPEELLAKEDQIEAEIGGLCDRLREELQNPEHLDVFLARPTQAPQTPDMPAVDAAKAKRQHQQALATYEREKAEAMFILNQLDAAERNSAEIRQDLARQIEELRGWVGGKLCMIGSIASGAADFVPTPMHKRTPGVWVHSNILNTIFSGAFIRKARPAVDILAILLAGMIASLLTVGCPVWAAGPLVLLLALAYAAFNSGAVFQKMNVWLVFWHPMAAMALSFAVVTAYRQLTEERAKRFIRNLFAHALSPALVDQLVANPSMAQLGGERRELTFLFSDLQGFTPLSERLGEEQTVKLLNRYFDRMTEVIQDRCGGYLNKFLGDGLFVFFGAPVLQEDHAARALRAALGCQKEIGQLNRELIKEFDGSVQLVSRIGIATGEVMVGNCGSSQRMDYTAIGDTVNLASRLESANKFFGTRILISQESWRQGGHESLLARPLGKIMVVGKREAVGVWNLLCQVSEAPDQLKEACGGFAAAIELFNRRRFNEAARLLENVKEILSEDKPTEIFLDLCHSYQANPPGDDWDGALQLTEK